MRDYEIDDAIRSMISRARIVKVDDSKSQQRVNLKGRKYEEPEEVYRVMPFGQFSVPPKDSEGLLLQMGGRSDRMTYIEGGHEKYRPKNRPAGSSGIFDQYGNLIQSDKDKLGFTHGKKLNLALGKGYDADGAENYSGPAVSIEMTKDSVIIQIGSSKITMTPTKILHEAPTVTIKSNDVNLGDEGGDLIGLCGGGCATKVKAV